MANITKVTGRHIWKETILARGNVKVPHSMICMNCRVPWYGDNKYSPPLTGCSSDIDVSRLGDDRLRDYRKQEMKIREMQEAEDLNGV